jgi:hypothetical protein
MYLDYSNKIPGVKNFVCRSWAECTSIPVLNPLSRAIHESHAKKSAPSGQGFPMFEFA